MNLASFDVFSKRGDRWRTSVTPLSPGAHAAELNINGGSLPLVCDVPKPSPACMEPEVKAPDVTRHSSTLKSVDLICTNTFCLDQKLDPHFL
jgi:hypothetical protein